MDARFDAPMPPRGFGESLFPCWTTRNMLRASPSRSRVTRESQCSRQQRLDPRTALAERGPPGGAPRTGQRAAARFASHCPRLMGSVIEGEDVVQDTPTLAKSHKPGGCENSLRCRRNNTLGQRRRSRLEVSGVHDGNRLLRRPRPEGPRRRPPAGCIRHANPHRRRRRWLFAV